MLYSGTYSGTIHTFCDQFSYTDAIAFTIDQDGNVELPSFVEGSLQSGKIDGSGHVTGASITVNSLSLGQVKIPYSGSDNGTFFSISGTSANNITSIIQANLISSGSSKVEVTDNGDGTHAVTGSGDDLTLHSVGNDVMTGGGVRDIFVFTPGFGQNEVTDFIAGGQNRDTIDLSETHYSSLAQVLRHTTMSDGSATIQLNPHDSITLDGITKGQLKAHPNDFAFG